ncbi:hypothetical protein BBP40_012101, partial [Aspergillus hancockii]
DKSGPECLRCQRSRRQCIPAPPRPNGVTFRHGQNPSLRSRGPVRYGESALVFPDDQVWVETSSKVEFEDETGNVAAGYNVVPIEEPPLYLRKGSESQMPTSVSTLPSSTSSIISPALTLGVPESPQLSFGFPLASINNLFPANITKDDQNLSNVDEALLLRHFRNIIGAWLDVCDHERHFSVHVVERAPSCKLLLYTCLATAARHLSRTNHSISPNIADKYHEQCIAILLDVLHDTEFKISFEILLASTVILRLFEQISSYTPTNDLQRHLLAGSVYISSNIDCAISGGLAGASFWVFVLQDVQFALVHRCPLRLAISTFEKSLRLTWAHHTTKSDDRDWAHRAIWLLAETVNYCYETNHPLHIESVGWEGLKKSICEWETQMPNSFRPQYFTPANPSLNRPFPILLFSSPAHAAQHICMAKALIQEYELSAMHFTPNSNQGAKNLENNILSNLNALFGIALSTDDDPSVCIMACHALCACKNFSLWRSVELDDAAITSSERCYPAAHGFATPSRKDLF